MATPTNTAASPAPVNRRAITRIHRSVARLYATIDSATTTDPATTRMRRPRVSPMRPTHGRSSAADTESAATPTPTSNPPPSSSLSMNRGTVGSRPPIAMK